MNRPMMDMRMMRDMARGRRRMNVVGRRTDMAMNRRMPYENYEMNTHRDMPRMKSNQELYETEHNSRRNFDYGTGEYNPRDSIYNRELYGYYGDTPFEIRRSYPMRDYNMDYARGGRRDYGYDYNYGMDYGEDYKLDKQDIEHWTKKLMKDIDDKEKEMFSKEKVLNKAKEMGIKFEEFTPEEYYVTVLMTYTDYCKTLGSANIDLYLRLAKDWLMDDDVEIKYGEKLGAYFDNIVMPE